MHGLLYAYGIQLHYLTPNGVLHLVCFFVLCECLLGVHPHWGLWKAIFNVKRNVGGGSTYTIAGLASRCAGIPITFFGSSRTPSKAGARSGSMSA